MRTIVIRAFAHNIPKGYMVSRNYYTPVKTLPEICAHIRRKPTAITTGTNLHTHHRRLAFALVTLPPNSGYTTEQQ
jgi:hypothetical protein